MPSHSPPHPLLPSALMSPLIIVVVVFVGLITTSFSDDATFSNCTRTFSCGSVQNITYPFTGGDRPGYCGPPEFRLSCRDNYSELTSNSMTYRVLQINQTQQTLTLARIDLWNNTCPRDFVNATINATIFSYGIENEDLTLIYGCNLSATTLTPQNLFFCTVSGVNFSDAYYLVGPTPSDPILRFIYCSVSVTLPVIRTAGDWLTGNRISLGEALTQGFNVNYSDPYEKECSECTGFGGQCGFDSNAGQPVCICGQSRCFPFSAGSPNGLHLHLGSRLAIGFSFVVVGIIIMFFVISIRRQWISVNAIFFCNKGKMKDQSVESFVSNYGSLAPKRYSYFDIKKMTSTFKDTLGQGAYGVVYKGKLSDARLVAVKVLNEAKGDGGEFINEVASISRTSHVNVVSLLGFCVEREKRALIYEFMPNKSLDKFICNVGSSNKSCRLDWKISHQIAVGIARGLEYLHRGCNTRIVHFDIKPQNILLDEDFCPKISDFGLAKLCQRKESIVSLQGARGTPGYIAPEVFCRTFGGVSHKSDVYSYGMMVLDMVGARENVKVGVASTSETYFPDWIYEHLELGEDLRVNGVTTQEEKETRRKMILVSLWCIQTNPADRPSMSKVLEMFEGSLQSLQIPAKPFLFSPPRPAQDYSASLAQSSETIVELTKSISQ